MNNYIKNLIATKGWKDVKDRMKQEIVTCKDPSNIDPTSDNEIYAREVRARVIAAKALETLINNIELSAGGDPTKKISYK